MLLPLPHSPPYTHPAPPPKKKVYGLNMKQMIQIEMVRQTRRVFTPASVLGVCELERSYFKSWQMALMGAQSFS